MSNRAASGSGGALSLCNGTTTMIGRYVSLTKLQVCFYMNEIWVLTIIADL